MKKHTHFHRNRHKKKSFDIANFDREFSQEVGEIKKRSKQAELAYKLNSADRKRIIELIVIAKDLPQKFLYDGQHCMHTILSIVMNTVDKEELIKDLQKTFQGQEFKSPYLKDQFLGK